jgi:hypothetical protein
MLKFDLRVPDVHKVIDDLDAFKKHNPRAIALAMNQAGRKARTKALRNVYDTKLNSDAWNVRAKDIKRMAGRDKKATASNHKYVFEFRSKGGAVLLDFTRHHDRRDQTKKGVRYRIKKKTRSKVYKHAFINTSRKRGSDFALLREGKDRYPIIPLAVVSPSYMFAKSNGVEVFKTTFQSEFRKAYLQKLKYLIG